jgi:hypothetical protein
MACPAANNLSGQDLGGKTLTPGVYCFSSSVGLTGQLVLDARGDANAVWVFQIGSTITTATNSSVVMINGGQPCNVFWAVGSSATIGTGTAFQGNILAVASITLVSGAGLVGRALARDAAVTMDHNTVSIGSCGAAGHPSCKERGDRVTGGGWIIGRSGGKANFAVSGGINVKKNAFRGHLEYDDKGSKGKSDDFKVKVTGVTAYIVLNAVTRRIEGTAKVNGVPGWTYQVEVSDNGEPGRNNDVFAIRLWNNPSRTGSPFYGASGKLGGGNIQLHKGRACKEHGDDGDDGDDDD